MRNVAVIGLGYVGLPLAVELSKKMSVTGFDINGGRIKELNEGFDRTREVDEQSLRAGKAIYTTDLKEIARCLR